MSVGQPILAAAGFKPALDRDNTCVAPPSKEPLAPMTGVQAASSSGISLKPKRLALARSLDSWFRRNFCWAFANTDSS